MPHIHEGMSNDVREAKGATGAAGSVGGRYATKPGFENGTTLSAVPAVLEFGAARQAELSASIDWELTVRSELIEVLDVLDEQAREANQAALDAKNPVEARRAGADVAELAFMMETVALERHLNDNDLDLALAMKDIDLDFDAATDEARTYSAGYNSHQHRKVDLIVAMDLETDLGAGHRGWHEWHSEERALTIRDLHDHLDALPNDKDAPLWTEKLACLADPYRVRRLEIETRKSGAHGPVARFELAVQAAHEVRHLRVPDRLEAAAHPEG